MGPIVFDMDGVIAEQAPLINGCRDYANAEPYDIAVKNLIKVKKMGFKIVICTARGMGRARGDQNKAAALCYDETLKWLVEHNIPFDSLVLGKPSAYLYVDDKACKVDSRNGWLDWNINFWPQINKLSRTI